MRRSLIVTVAAAVVMVLLAMLVPMAILLSDYALEDRLATAALEVQATESVVSGVGEEKGLVNLYVDRLNQDNPNKTTVLYPPSTLHPDGDAIGPHPGEDARVAQARQSGRARVDDIEDGAEILVPVSLGGSSAAPENTPVIRIIVPAPGLTSGPTFRAILVLVGLGVALLVGALLMADRLGRSFVDPIRRLASWTQQLGETRAGGRGRPEAVTPAGPVEVRELTSTINLLVDRVERLLEREREAVSNLSHRLRTPLTALRLRIDGLSDAQARSRLGDDLDQLQLMVDHVVSEARRSEREGLVVSTPAVGVLTSRAGFWRPLAEDQGRALTVEATAEETRVLASHQDLDALLDVLLDNVFTHTPEGTAIAVTIKSRPGGGVRLVVDDAGPGFPEDIDVVERGTSGADSSGLGLAIAHKTATESGGGLVVGRAPDGGGRVVVELGHAG